MIKRITLLTTLFCMTVPVLAMARDQLLQFPIENALISLKIQSELYQDVQLFWGDQGYPDTKTVYGEYKTSQRTNGLGKATEDACQWALASSLKELQARALREGGNAVVNIKSNVKNIEKSSRTEYDCLVGGVMVNVALKGTVVKLAE